MKPFFYPKFCSRTEFEDRVIKMLRIFAIIIWVLMAAIIFLIARQNSLIKSMQSSINDYATSDICEQVVTNDDYILYIPYEETEEFVKDASLIAQTLWGESRGLSDYEQSLVAWCICNRLDSGRYGETFEEVITAPMQFVGYRPDNPITDKEYNIAADVLIRWLYEKRTDEDVCRTLPSEYLHFRGDGQHNYFYTGDGNWTKFDFDTSYLYDNKSF